MVPRPMRQPNIEDSSKLRASRDDRRAARSGQMYPSYDKTDGLYSNASPAALLDGSVEKVQLHHQPEEACLRRSAAASRQPVPQSQPPSYPGQQNHAQDQSDRHQADSKYRPSRGLGGGYPDRVQAHFNSSPPRGDQRPSSPRPGIGRRIQLSPDKTPDLGHQRNSSLGAAMAAGASIDRLSSPGINKTVLQPLECKIREYSQLMSETQNEISTIDEQLRILQERRNGAEDRYLEAKTKHDDYERQHQDVGRALRGEFVSVDRFHQVQDVISQPSPRLARMESFEESRPVSQPISHIHNRSRTFDKLRTSLFKGL